MRIDIRPPTTAQLSGFKAVGGTLIITLSWVLPTTDPSYRAAEVWMNSVNDFESATLYNVVGGNQIDVSVSEPIMKYFWIRSVNEYGRADGAITGPVSATANLIGNAQVGVFDLATLNIINKLSAGNITGLGALATLGITDAQDALNLGNLAFANSLAANRVGAGTLAAGVIYSGTINASQINSGTLNSININAGNGAFSVNGATGRALGNNMEIWGLVTSDSSGVNGEGAISATSTRTGNPGINASSMRGHGVTSSGGSGYNSFYAFGGAGYGPFTGSHDVLWPKLSDNIDIGDIVVDVECISRSGISDTIFLVERSSKANQKGVVGIFADRGLLLDGVNIPAAFPVDTVEVDYEDGRKGVHRIPGSEYDAIKDDYRSSTINSLGEGQMNVCGLNGNIEKGDLIVTSAMPGKGMRQDDDLVRSYTVARAREAVVFEHPEQVKQVACIYLCG